MARIFAGRNAPIGVYQPTSQANSFSFTVRQNSAIESSSFSHTEAIVDVLAIEKSKTIAEWSKVDNRIPKAGHTQCVSQDKAEKPLSADAHYARLLPPSTAPNWRPFGHPVSRDA